MTNDTYQKIILKTGLTTGQIERQSGVNRSIIWRLKKGIPTNLTHITRDKLNKWIETNSLNKISLIDWIKCFFVKKGG